MSAVYWPAPRRKRVSSLRSMRAPMSPAGRAVPAAPARSRTVESRSLMSVMAISSGHLGQALLHGLHDVVITGAAAKVAVERLADLLLARVRVFPRQAHGREHHAGRAEAALQSVVLLEGRLHRVQRAVCRQALDGGELRALRLHGEQVATLHRLAIEEHGAGAALRGVASDVRSREAQVLSQEVDKESAG